VRDATALYLSRTEGFYAQIVHAARPSAWYLAARRIHVECV